MSMSKFHILGSGASTAVPWLACALAPRVVSSEPLGGNIPDSCCAVCADAIDNPTGPNKRGNVSAALRLERPDGAGDFCVVIDCGKTFRDTVGRVWPRLDPPLRRIDALLLTHPHADAFMGMDCLREVSPSDPVHVYCHAPTFERVRWAFPYLVPAGAGESLVGGIGGVADKAQGPAATGGACCAPAPPPPIAAAAAAAPTPTPPIPTTYIATLIFHIVTPWVPFELEGSGGLLVTPIPVEHAGRAGAPFFSDADTCLAFEFGASLSKMGDAAGDAGAVAAGVDVRAPTAPASTSASAPTPAPTPAPATITPAPTLLLDARGLPTLPPWKGDRILWVSDVRAISADVRAYLACRPTTLLLIDALGFREYPTHFSIGQALACAADMMGPLSATAAAARGGEGERFRNRRPCVRLVGINHEVDHLVEEARLQVWAAAACLERPAVGGEPLVWLPHNSDQGALLDLDIGIGHDGFTRAMVFGARYESIAQLAAEIAAVRNAASALAADDATDYAALARVRSAVVTETREAEASGAAEPFTLTPRLTVLSSRVGAAVLRHREDFLDCLPLEFRSYRESPSAIVRDGWRFKAATYRTAPITKTN